jgi:hypothetical protein
MKLKLIVIFIISTSNLFAGTSNVTDLKGDINALAKTGVGMSSSSELMLNQHLKKNGAKLGQYYQVQYVCKHNKKMDKCKLVKVNFSN